MEGIDLTIVALLFAGWLAKGIAWVAFDAYILKNQYGDLDRTLFGIVLWPVSSAIRIWKWIEGWLRS